jgi:hypothetical protein
MKNDFKTSQPPTSVSPPIGDIQASAQIRAALLAASLLSDQGAMPAPDVALGEAEQPVEQAGAQYELPPVVSSSSEKTQETVADLNRCPKYESEISQPPAPVSPLVDGADRVVHMGAAILPTSLLTDQEAMLTPGLVLRKIEQLAIRAGAQHELPPSVSSVFEVIREAASLGAMIGLFARYGVVAENSFGRRFIRALAELRSLETNGKHDKMSILLGASVIRVLDKFAPAFRKAREGVLPDSSKNCCQTENGCLTSITFPSDDDYFSLFQPTDFWPR